MGDLEARLSNKILFSKETVVLYIGGRVKHAGKFGFIKGVDKSRITTVNVWKADVERVSIRQPHISLNFECDQ